jgi:SAM-dependent methyltransferase
MLANKEAAIILGSRLVNNRPRMAHPVSRRAEWQLPPGVPRGVWEYAQAEHIAEEYDAYFADNALFEFDEQVLARHFRQPGLVVDLGCGTGRALVALARRGFPGLAVDLSPAMLRIVAEKAAAEKLPIQCLQANLVELDCVADASVDYAVCLFSTWGMIRGRENRRKALGHARRILKPDGLFVLHVHNLWYNVFDAAGRAYLARHLLEAAFRRDVELGDKFFPYRDIPQMYLHTFRRRELLRELRRAGLAVEEFIPLDAGRQRPLRRAWWLGGIRANGWVVVCRRPAAGSAFAGP